MSDTNFPKQGKPISAVVAEVPLRRDLAEALPLTPSDLDFYHFPPTIAAVKALLPLTLREQFEQEVDQTPFQQLERLVMEWGIEAISLHDDEAQQSLEMIKDGDKEGLKVMFSPLPNWDEG